MREPQVVWSAARSRSRSSTLRRVEASAALTESICWDVFSHSRRIESCEAEDTVTSMIRERPLMAVGIAFAAGLVMCKASSAARHRS